MATWTPLTIDQTVKKIINQNFVLPVIQRKLVWTTEQMERLFETALKKNSFGGIMVIHDKKGCPPLFPYRYFSDHGIVDDSRHDEDPLLWDIDMVVDGQQRLQTFLIGLTGEYEGEELHFNLLSEKGVSEFAFSRAPGDLPLNDVDPDEFSLPNIWFPVRGLYKLINGIRDHGSELTQATAEEQRQIVQSHCKEIAAQLIELKDGIIVDDNQKNRVYENVGDFYTAIFVEKCVGIATVEPNRSGAVSEDQNREMVANLFTLLNNGGTRLSTYDLVASKMKSYNDDMESIFNEIESYRDIGINQDQFIKLIMILQGYPDRDVSKVTKEDTEFVTKNKDQILRAMAELRNFLKAEDLEDYFKGNTTPIPLYFIVYSLFYNGRPEEVVRKHDTSPDYVNMRRWLNLVLLNEVYSSGRRVRWKANRTGVRKTLVCLKPYQNVGFPCEALFDVYNDHGLEFYDEVTVENVNRLNRNFIFYLIYKKKDKIRQQDLDHIQPKSLLEGRYTWDKINHMANFAKMSSDVNRGIKSNRPLNEWINSLPAPDEYRGTHLIPDQSELWTVERFDDFLKARACRIVEKINAEVPQRSAVQPILLKPASTTANGVNTTFETTDERLKRNWENRMRLVEQYGVKDLFDQFHTAMEKAGLWVTPREQALVYHHRVGGTRSFFTVYIYPGSWYVNVNLHHFPKFYQNPIEELNALLWEGEKWFSPQMIPQFIEKVNQLKTR